MDTTPQPTHVSLCAGYGGIDLGLRRAIPDLLTIAYCEIEGFACANLVAKMEARLLDPAPVWTDLRTFPFADFHGRVDIISGGFPCQPFSNAGKRLGDEDPRHLFPAILRGIRAANPAVVFLENVEGIISAKLAGNGWADPAGTPVLLHVLRELERVGYRATAGVFSASEVGAPHQRKRVFILANRQNTRLEGLWFNSRKPENAGSGGGGASVWPSRPGEPQFGWEPPRVVANTRGQESAWLPQPEGRDEGAKAGIAGAGVGDATNSGSPQRRPGAIHQPGAVQESQRSDGSSERQQTEPEMGGDVDGGSHRMDYAELYVTCDNRTDELRLLGNGVVPATAERAYRVLAARLLSQ